MPSFDWLDQQPNREPLPSGGKMSVGDIMDGTDDYPANSESGFEPPEGDDEVR